MFTQFIILIVLGCLLIYLASRSMKEIIFKIKEKIRVSIHRKLRKSIALRWNLRGFCPLPRPKRSHGDSGRRADRARFGRNEWTEALATTASLSPRVILR